MIKDGKVRTHGTPSQIIRDPIAISEYLGTGFNDDGFDTPPSPQRTVASVAKSTPQVVEYAPASATKPPANAIHNVLEQEKIQRFVEGLKTPDQAHAAAELTKRGQAAVPALLAALERRDVEMRRQAVQVLQTILKRPLTFDPYAPEALRRQQLTALREMFERKAG